MPQIINKDGDEVKGVKCSCGVLTPFAGYVYAHWSIPLTFTCECGKTYGILRGVATAHRKSRNSRG